MKPRLLSVLNTVMFVVFVLCVAVQFNDPDPLIWMTVYGVAAGLCLLAILRRLHWTTPVVLGLISLAWAIQLAGEAEGVSWGDLASTLSMKTLEVEKAREAGGLLIVTVWMVVLSIAGRGGPKT